ncbi:hypothetical protein [Neiella marina]|uniref:hypothetical protein n=1 Tax=Neiella marina TaxID=508461 RepID=UPI000B3CDDCB|nr:hypothetical protein [Neiella marina]
MNLPLKNNKHTNNAYLTLLYLLNDIFLKNLLLLYACLLLNTQHPVSQNTLQYATGLLLINAAIFILDMTLLKRAIRYPLNTNIPHETAILYVANGIEKTEVVCAHIVHDSASIHGELTAPRVWCVDQFSVTSELGAFSLKLDGNFPFPLSYYHKYRLHRTVKQHLNELSVGKTKIACTNEPPQLSIVPPSPQLTSNLGKLASKQTCRRCGRV